MRTRRSKVTPCVLIILATAGGIRAEPDSTPRQLARDVFQQLTELNSANSGDASEAIQALRKRLLDGGFSSTDLYVGGASRQQINLVARIHGTGKRRPILFLSHFDLKRRPARDEETDPRHLIERGGYFYGQGSTETNAGDALLLTTMLQLKREGYKPGRDIIVAIAADEKGGNASAFDWLLNNHRDLIDAAFIIDAGAGRFEMENGHRLVIGVETSEKLNEDFELSTTDDSGPISLPTTESAIYTLLDGLTRIEHYTFPFELNDTTRAYFQKMSEGVSGSIAGDMKGILQTPASAYAVGRISKMPYYKALTHTTCIATDLAASHSGDELPRSAKAIVNCEILPGRTVEQVRRILVKVAEENDKAGPEITITATSNREATASSTLLPDFIRPLERVTGEMWPGVEVIPTMGITSTEAVYSRAVGIPTYGVSGLWTEIGDETKAPERILAESYYDGVEFFYRFAKALTSVRQ